MLIIDGWLLYNFSYDYIIIYIKITSFNNIINNCILKIFIYYLLFNYTLT